MRMLRNAEWMLGLAVLLSAAPGRAQLVEDFNPPKANCCLQFMAQGLADQLQDWNQLGRYHADNVKLRAQAPEPTRVIFCGDSITDGWKLEEYFPGKPYVNRGISGQTTPQMLVRMFPDVINLHPAALIILAGTNDIARNTGPESAEIIEDNFRAITELAQRHGIKVLLCSILPISDYIAKKQSDRRPPADILKLNAWLRKYAQEKNLIYVDYYSALVNEKGFLKEGYSEDGLHPNNRGYQLMAPLAESAIEKVLK
jgi:lysophospholipase L1-like esterase